MTARGETPIRILMVEDDEGDYLLTRRLLSKVYGQTFDVVWAPTLAQGLERIQDNIDAVLLDLTLPDSHGWDTFTRMKGKAGQVPVILLTAATDESLGLRAIHKGAQDYLTKGEITSALLGKAIRYAIERKQIERDRERIGGELRARNAQMTDELRTAHDMQRALLGRRFPVFPPWAGAENSALRFAYLYRPTRIVGGDFFTVLPVSNTMAGILICDVMGHGVRSALVTAMIRGLVEELRSSASDPAQFLSQMNDGLNAVLGSTEEPLFASALYCTLDAADGAARWANAGHPHPLHLRPGDNTVEEWRGGAEVGPAMGIVRNVSYTACSGQLAPGDRILLLTDGVYEMQCPDGGDYGMERLVRAARANLGASLDVLLAALLKDVETAARKDEPADDICLLGVQWTRAVPEDVRDELPP